MQKIKHRGQLPHRPESPPRQLRRRRRRNQRRHDLAAGAALVLSKRRHVAGVVAVVAVLPPPIPLVLLPGRGLGLAMLGRRLRGRIEPRGGADGARARRPVAPRQGRPRRRGVGLWLGGGAVLGVGAGVAGDRRRRGFAGHGEREIERVYWS